MLNTVLDQDNLGWRHKDGIGARTQVSFIKTALVWAACNSSESLVLTVVWQDSDSLDSGRERWFNKSKKESAVSSSRSLFKSASHTASQLRVYWLRAPNHTGVQLAHPITLFIAPTRGARLWVTNEQLPWSELRAFHPFPFNFVYLVSHSLL